ncbi:MAG: peptidylprolyl isomerase [Erysipelotrichaceae bacterium]|nr:peptidylprolyl isomerase [Erysipelotrichaceae bacterium]
MKRVKIVMALILLMAMFGCAKKQESVPQADETVPQSEETAAGEVIRVSMKIKDYGEVLLELYPDVAPVTVENFTKLVKDGFYDGNSFHRIIDGFMIQGGIDWSGTVKNIKGEFASNGFENDLKHTEGVISMARAKDPDSASSQFFIMVGNADWLDGEYAAFGKVTDGLDIVKKIAADARPIDNNGSIAEEERPVIESVRIIE